MRGQRGKEDVTEFLDELANFPDPFYGHVFISPLQTSEFISSFIADDGGVFSVGEACVGIHVGK